MDVSPRLRRFKAKPPKSSRASARFSPDTNSASAISAAPSCSCPAPEHRPGYGEARKKVYQGVFTEDAYPPNSGIYIRSLGENILLRSMAIAYRGEQRIVASPKVRLAPGSFSQSVRVGDWLLLAGQDAVTFDRVVECEGSLAGQTEATLRHSKDIVEAAGGTLDDIVKTTVYLVEGSNRVEFAEAYRRFFAAHSRNSTMPAGLTVVVDRAIAALLWWKSIR